MNQSELIKEKKEENEIDLIQLFQILLRRKWVIFGVALFCIAAGVIFALIRPKVYTYTSSIIVGSVDGANLINIERGVALLKESFIPEARKKILEKYHEMPSEIKVEVPKDSEVIVLRSRQKEGNAQREQEAQRIAVEMLKKELQGATDLARNNMLLEKSNAEITLKELNDPDLFENRKKEIVIKLNEVKSRQTSLLDQEKLVKKQTEQLLATQLLLEQQIREAEQRLAEAYKIKPESSVNIGNEARAMTMLMINSQIQQENNQLAAMRERTTIEIEGKLDLLEKDADELKRQKTLITFEFAKTESDIGKLKIERDLELERQLNIIRSIENKMATIKEVRALSVASPSVEPVGLSGFIILLLSGVVGIMSGVIGAFVTELLVIFSKSKSSGCLKKG